MGLQSDPAQSKENTTKKIAFAELTPTERKEAVERLELKKKLICAYKVLKEMSLRTDLKVSIIEEFLKLEITGKKELKIKEPKNPEAKRKAKNRRETEIVDYVYTLLDVAQAIGISYFFDDESRLISLEGLIQNIQNLYGNASILNLKALGSIRTLASALVLKNTVCYAKNQKLNVRLKKSDLTDEYFSKFPKKAQQLLVTDHDRLWFSLLQNIYPIQDVSNPIVLQCLTIPPRTFLCSYKNYITSEKLFQFGALILKFPQHIVDLQQKMRVLHLFLMWSKSNLFNGEKGLPKVQAGFARLKNRCVKLNNIEMNNLVNEIQISFDTRHETLVPIDLKYHSKENYLKTDNYIKKIAVHGTECIQFGHYVRGVAAELKRIAARFVSSLTPFCFLSEKPSPDFEEISEFVNKLSLYVKNTYDSYLHNTAILESNESLSNSDSQQSPMGDLEHSLDAPAASYETSHALPVPATQVTHLPQIATKRRHSHFILSNPPVRRAAFITSRSSSSSLESSPLSSDSDSPRHPTKDDVCNNITLLFISFLDQLTKENNFLCGLSIYSALRVSRMWDQILKMKKLKKEGLLRSQKDIEILDRFEVLREIYSEEHAFAKYKEKVMECERSGVFYIPILGVLKQSILHKLSEKELDLAKRAGPETNSDIDFEQMHYLSAIIMDTNKILENIRLFQAQIMGKDTYNTSDIGKEIFKQIE